MGHYSAAACRRRRMRPCRSSDSRFCGYWTVALCSRRLPLIRQQRRLRARMRVHGSDLRSRTLIPARGNAHRPQNTGHHGRNVRQCDLSLHDSLPLYSNFDGGRTPGRGMKLVLPGGGILAQKGKNETTVFWAAAYRPSDYLCNEGLVTSLIQSRIQIDVATGHIQ